MAAAGLAAGSGVFSVAAGGRALVSGGSGFFAGSGASSSDTSSGFTGGSPSGFGSAAGCAAAATVTARAAKDQSAVRSSVRCFIRVISRPRGNARNLRAHGGLGTVDAGLLRGVGAHQVVAAAGFDGPVQVAAAEVAQGAGHRSDGLSAHAHRIEAGDAARVDLDALGARQDHAVVAAGEEARPLHAVGFGPAGVGARGLAGALGVEVDEAGTVEIAVRRGVAEDDGRRHRAVALSASQGHLRVQRAEERSDRHVLDPHQSALDLLEQGGVFGGFWRNQRRLRRPAGAISRIRGGGKAPRMAVKGRERQLGEPEELHRSAAQVSDAIADPQERRGVEGEGEDVIVTEGVRDVGGVEAVGRDAGHDQLGGRVGLDFDRLELVEGARAAALQITDPRPLETHRQRDARWRRCRDSRSGRWRRRSRGLRGSPRRRRRRRRDRWRRPGSGPDRRARSRRLRSTAECRRARCARESSAPRPPRPGAAGCGPGRRGPPRRPPHRAPR